MPVADTIAAIATPPGRGGVGIVRVSGAARAVEAIALAVVGRPLSARQATFARFRDDSGETIDEGLALLFPGPGSYTGETVLELHGHGGPVILRVLLERCLGLGARIAEPGEFTRRAFLNDKLDLAQAEAVADLIDASTAQAARGAIRSLQGAFSDRIHALQADLTRLRTLVEGTLDFPEEDVDILQRADAQGQIDRLRMVLAELLAAAHEGQVLRDGIRVVLTGRPNVGKSSLINRLAGEDVAIVTELPGTTRDLVRQHLQVRGVPLHVIDSAGLREATDPVERIGIERTWQELGRADAIVHVLDAVVGETDEDRALAARMPAGTARVRVYNKVDLCARTPRRERDAAGWQVWMSARTGAGVEWLGECLLDIAGVQLAGEGTFLARTRHVEALRECAGRIAAASGLLASLELCAEELRLAQLALSRITGEVSADDLLGEIFSKFCIGK